MRKLLIAILLLTAFISYGQQSNFTNTKFVNGLAVPNGATELPTSGLTAGAMFYKTGVGLMYYNGSAWVTLGISGAGVQSFSAGTLSPLFTTSVATATTTPALTFSLSTVGARRFFGNSSASTATPSYSLITQTDVTSLVDSLTLKPFTTQTITSMQAYAGTATAVVVKDTLRGGTFVYNSSSLTVDNGTVFTATGKGAGVWQRLYDRTNGLNVTWYGAVPDGVTNSTAAIQAAINYAADFKVKVTIPYGIFLISGLTMNGNDVTIQGAGMSSTQSSYSVTFGGTILKMDATAAVAIAIGSTGSVERVKLSDFTIQGSPTALGGISVGTASNYVAFSKFDRLQIINFRATNQYGVILNESQENVFDGCQITHNYYNIYRPDVGYTTSTVFQGGNSYIGFSSIASLYAIGDIADLTFRDIIFESDSTQSVKSSANKATLTFQNCYFEFSNIKGTATSLIEVLGETGAYGQSSLLIENNVFHAPANPMFTLKTDYVIAQVKSNRGLFEAGGVSATANSTNIFNFNNLEPSAGDLKTLYLGIGGTVIVDDKNYSGGRYTIGGINLYGALQVPQMANTATNDSTVVYNAGVLERTLTSTLAVGSSLTATTATNLAGGSGGTIPYQSAAGTTAMLANGTAGYILQANGTTVAPSWVPGLSGYVPYTGATGYLDLGSHDLYANAIAVAGNYTGSAGEFQNVNSGGAGLGVQGGTTQATSSGAKYALNVTSYTNSDIAKFWSDAITFAVPVTMPTPFTLGATSVTTTGTRLNYLTSAGGTTGTASTNLVFSAAPTLTGTVGITTTGVLNISNTTSGAVSPVMLSLGNSFNTVGTGAKISFLVSATAATTGQIEAIRTGTGDAGNTDMVFKLSAGSAAAEKFRVISTGNLSFTGTTITGSSGGTPVVMTIPSATGTLATLTDNVASATILQTTRTIWGQNFNGSANVSGAITGATDITATGVVTLSNAAKMMGNTSAGTGSQYIQFTNTGADLFIGYNNSTGAGLIGGGNYASNIFTNNATALVLGTNATAGLAMNASTQAITLSNLSGTGSRAVVADANGVLSAPVSDRNAKIRITPLKYGLKEINQFKPSSFYYNKAHENFGTTRQLGNIAQDVKPLIPEAVFWNEKKKEYGIDYNQLWAPMIKAIQELSAQVDSQQTIIKKQDARILALEKLYLELKK